MPWRACAALFSLLETHRVDRHGRCRQCRHRRPPLVWLLWPRWHEGCQVHRTACFWLNQLDEGLLWQFLARLPALDTAQDADPPSSARSPGER